MPVLATIDCALQSARVHTQGDQLIVTTGQMRRVWRWLDVGLGTTEISADSWPAPWTRTPTQCDWQLPDGAACPAAKLQSLQADVQDDEGFTSQHIAVTAEIAYPNARLIIRWTLWVYPDSPGVRTILAVKATDAGYAPDEKPGQGAAAIPRIEALPMNVGANRRRFFGYFNATQVRNDTHLDILQEEVIDRPLSYREWNSWASVACIEIDAGGVALVKESHKCVNQNGHQTGEFMVDERDGLIGSGWGLMTRDITPERFTTGWAYWSIAWAGGDVERERALKTFDAQRFPIDPARDVYVQANTWGSTPSGEEARLAATEKYVLEELDACAKLGIDVLQIDDGWQVPPGHNHWNPETNGWYPHPEGYPTGWGNIRKRAAELGIRLGLWAAAQPVSLDELKQNYTDGGFEQYKLDFAVLRNRTEIDDLMQKVRDFIAWTGHKVRVNWDVTENPARYGYFFARDYGCIYLENRKPQRPIGVIYRPHTVLRDLWQLSKYLNLHRFQCSIQNVDRVNPEFSDAHLHPHGYATAIALMGIPLFFQETKYYSDEAIAEIRPLLDVYKQHRDAIYRGVVYPIGAKPNNASWTGFQCHLADETRGYLMIYRERCNAESEQAIPLHWLAGEVEFTDLMQNTTWKQTIDAEGVKLTIPSAPGFMFIRYS